MSAPSRLPSDPEELKALFGQFLEASRTLEEQHARLAAEVEALRELIRSKDRQLDRKSRLEDMGRMAAGVAHEIRNPLGGIRLYTDLLIRRLEGEWETATATKIRSHIIMLERIVSDMLDFTREIVMRPRDIDPSAVLGEALSLARAHPSAAGRHVDVAMTRTTLCADPDQLQKVCLNIILNAFQAMEGDGELVVRGRVIHDSYVMTVCDTGPGIPDDKLDAIFTPFMTTKPEGTGLGLAIAHRVMEEHDGRIEVRNNAGRGVTVTLVLPLQPTRVMASAS